MRHAVADARKLEILLRFRQSLALAWHEALEIERINLSIWRIHRKVGMSGGLFTNMLLRETGQQISPERVERLRNLHTAAYKRQSLDVQPLPGRGSCLHI